MTRNERNQAARKLLAYFYAGYERVGSRSFYISPQEHGVLEELGWDRQQYMVAMQGLIDKRLLKPMTLGGGCSITEDGVEASEDQALLDQLLPVDPAPAPEPLPASPPPAVASTAGSFEYEVALSFAGEDRAHAEALAEYLKERGVPVFYDLYEQADLWGKDLFEHLHEVYSKKARYCVLFASASYAKKVWTDHERRSAQDRALREKGNAYILPIRIDGTEIPGIRSSTGHLSISMGIPAIGGLLLQKLGRSGNTDSGAEGESTSAVPASPTTPALEDDALRAAELKRLIREKQVPTARVHMTRRGGGGVPEESITFNLIFAVLEDEAIHDVAVQFETDGAWQRLIDITLRVPATASHEYVIPKDAIVFEQEIRLRYTTRIGAQLEDTFTLAHDTRKSDSDDVRTGPRRLLASVI